MARSKLEPQNPDTAVKRQSIWKAIDRTAMERKVQALSEKQHVPDRRVYEAMITFEDDESYYLPFEVEKSLADDFAFIAACQPQVDSVSAATIEQDRKRCSLTMRLAANAGVAVDVHETFDEIFAILQKHASKEISRDRCQAQLFHNILQLNRNRLLGRLGSRRFALPAHLVKRLQPLPTRLRQLFNGLKRSNASHVNCVDIDNLDQQIRDFEVAFQQLESAATVDLIPSLGHAVERAFDLTENGVRLPARLKALGCSDAQIDARDVREVGKVSNYWRISRHLTLCSARFDSYFANAAWFPVPHYRASSTSRILSRQFVHAEMQLLVHYELHSPPMLPRAIGVSKEACFLCDSFLRAHGRFAFTGAHRQIFPQWSVPNLKEYKIHTIEHFRKVLSQVYVQVNEEFMKAQKKLPWRPFPLQSAINLGVVLLSTPSVSTIKTRSRRSPDDVSEEGDSSLTASDITLRQAAQYLDPRDPRNRDADRAVWPAVSSMGGRQALSTSIKHYSQDRSIPVLRDNADSGETGWLDVYACFSNSSNDATVREQRRHFVGGTISLTPAPRDLKGRTIRLTDIPTTEELIIVREPDDTQDAMSFDITGSEGRKVRFHCQWHAASSD